MRWASVVSLASVATVLILSGVLEGDARALASNLAQTLSALLAGLVAVGRGRTADPSVRRFWLALGAGCLSWGSGQAIWTFYESVLGREAPLPSLADVGYLAFGPLVVVAVLSLPGVGGRSAGGLRGVIDGTVIAGGVLMCAWIVVLGPVYRAGAEDPLSLTFALAYPAGDTVIFTVVAYAAMRQRLSILAAPVPVLLAVLGLCCIALADVAFVFLTTAGTYGTGGIVDLGWVFGFAILAVAAARPERPVDKSRLPGAGKPVGVMLPNLIVCLAVFVACIERTRTGTTDSLITWVGATVIVLLIARQSYTLRENHSLTRNLEERVAVRTAELQVSRARFAALVAHSSDVVTVLDADGVITYQSDSSHRVLGHLPQAWVGRPALHLVDGSAEGLAFLEAFRYAVAEPGRIHTVTSAWRLESGRCDVEVTFTNLLGDADVGGVVLNTRNITDRKFLEDQLVHQAFHDALTGLANRALFRDRLEHALTRRDTSTVTVLYTDLDGFKTVNDTRGHGSGDLILCQVAGRLAQQVRGSDTVARIGGDEFAVLVDDVVEPGYVRELAERVSHALREPFHLDGQEIHLSGSIGIAELTPDVQSGEQLLRNADLAMYQAKSTGDGSYAFYAPAMHTRLVDQMRLESDLRTALDNEDFEVYYQPLVSLATGAITGVEALLRWNHAEHGFIEPSVFIPVAESTGMIRPLGLWVLREACRQASTWHRELCGSKDLRLHVNLSGRQLEAPDMADRIEHVLIETGMPARCLTLEMTESVLMANSDDTLRTLTRIRDLGVRLAIDDFGTGYSSLSYLHQFPVDILKIDRSFVEGLSSGGDATLVLGILQLAQSLGMESVAEGITRVQDARMLLDHGCTTGQGYLYSCPVPVAQMTALLTRPVEV